MFATLSDSLLSGAIPTLAVMIGGATFSVAERRRKKKTAPVEADHAMVMRHEKQLTEVLDTLKGTTDMLGRSRNDGVLQKVDNLKDTVDAIASDVKAIRNGHS